jgi:hypothetical protein
MSPIIVFIALPLVEFVAVVLYMRRGAFTQEKRVKLIIIVLSFIVLNVVIGILMVVLFSRLPHT